MRLLDYVFCGSCLVYVPMGREGGEVGQRSRTTCFAVKQGNEGLIAKIAAYVGNRRGENGVRCLHGEETTLVPMPRSAPLLKDQLWPTDMLAKALVSEHLGTSVLPLLERAVAVQKSSTAAPGTRPSARDHLNSFRIEPHAIQPKRIVIIDDVVTRGATMLAAISAVSEAIPGAQVEGFARFRTESTGDCTATWSPVRLKVSLLKNGHTQRKP